MHHQSSVLITHDHTTRSLRSLPRIIKKLGLMNPKLIKEAEVQAVGVRSCAINVRRRDGSMPEAIIEHRERDSIVCIRTTSDIENEVYRMPFHPDAPCIRIPSWEENA